MKRSKTYFCHNVLSFHLIHMKPTPKCSPFDFLCSDVPHDMVTSLLWFIGLYVCMLPTYLKNCWTKLYEIIRNDLSSSKDQSIRFWVQTGQRSRSRSWKGQKRIFVIPRSVFVRCTWNQRQNVHFSIPYPLSNVALAKVCTLPSARSIFFFFFFLTK